mmetsp:Transcript_23512/g.65407  ORF Transcript_23512/g.65407 Transcript_23512/m.65407 type:complete len:204 (-) Transcript_23512:163-774(-)
MLLLLLWSSLNHPLRLYHFKSCQTGENLVAVQSGHGSVVVVSRLLLLLPLLFDLIQQGRSSLQHIGYDLGWYIAPRVQESLEISLEQPFVANIRQFRLPAPDLVVVGSRITHYKMDRSLLFCSHLQSHSIVTGFGVGIPPRNWLRGLGAKERLPRCLQGALLWDERIGFENGLKHVKVGRVGKCQGIPTFGKNRFIAGRHLIK